MLHLSLFGHLCVARLEGETRSQAVDISGRPGSLLAYLALGRGRFFSRSELMNTLWADQGDPISTGTFNTTLWRLRKALAQPPLARDDLVVCDRRGAVGLNTEDALQVDVDCFAQLVAPALAKPLEALTDTDVAQLRRGVALYRDDILAGFSDDWALRERELHRRMMLNALARLMQVSVLAQDHAQAIAHAQDILHRDPLREDVHRELMRLFLVIGQRALALRQFELCREALRHELAIPPMPETLAVYQQIAEDAIWPGHAHRETELLTPSPPAHAQPPIAWPGEHAAQQRLAARQLIANARRYLAEADASLQQSLPLFDD